MSPYAPEHQPLPQSVRASHLPVQYEVPSLHARHSSQSSTVHGAPWGTRHTPANWEQLRDSQS